VIAQSIAAEPGLASGASGSADTKGDAAPPRVSTASASMVRFEKVSKFFSLRDSHNLRSKEMMVALDRVDATVAKGEFITLLGPSGCGKTTLLRIAAGLLLPDEGRVVVDGTPVTAPRRDACMVFQNFGLLPWRTVAANVEFPLELDGVGRAERQDRARHFLRLVGLERFAQHYPHELSGGMQQRVGIARALMRQPVLIMMDEPFGALDAQSREQLQEDFLKIWAHTSATVLFVTHSIDEALILSDRVFVFASGPGRIKMIFDSPLAADRLEQDVRTHPSFGQSRVQLRQLLKQGET
jgi:NitT/TauT family transport system ATP-binding protein